MNNRQLDLGTAPMKKLLFSMAVPTITAQIVNMLYNLVDRIYIGRIPEVGDIAFTGVSVCFPLIIFITGFASLMAYGAAPRASIAQGREDPEEAQHIMGNAFVMLLIAAACLTTVFLLFANPLLMAFGASEATVVYGETYLRIYAIGTVSVQLTLGMNAFITGQGFTRVSMKTVLIGAILNIILDPILIFGLGMGVAGAATATVISQTVSAIWVVYFLRSNKTKWRLERRYMKLKACIVKPSLALGLTPFIMTSTESIIAICFNTSLFRYGGDVAVGAYGAMVSVMQMIMMPLQGVAQGAQPITSYNYGARKPERVRASFKLLFKASITFSLVVCGTVLVFPQVFVGLFLTTPEMIAYASWGIRIYLFGMTLMGMQLACQQTFLAIGDAKTSLFLATLRKIFLLIPLIYILPNFFDDKAFAVLLAEPVADIIAITTTVVMFKFRFGKAMEALEKSV